jgi:hypothetical protein
MVDLEGREGILDLCAKLGISRQARPGVSSKVLEPHLGRLMPPRSGEVFSSKHRKRSACRAEEPRWIRRQRQA